jgi:hypothetical protein
MCSIDAMSPILAACTVLYAATMADASVVSPVDLREALANARPGSVLRIADGHYQDLGTLELDATGQLQQPIIVEPQTPGGVTFSGRMRLVMRGEHWHWRGFDFVGVHHPQVLHIEGMALRLSANRFIDCGDPTNTRTHLIRVGHTSTDVEIDHNYFHGSLSISIGTRTDADGGAAQRTRIHHNIFRDIVRLSPNGQEPIQLGNGPPELHAVRHDAVVERNLFDRADGDAEIISSKSSGNIIRQNVMANSRGAIWLRGGNDSIVANNLLHSSGVGIVVLGARHLIEGNRLVEPRHWGIELPTGTMTSIGDAGRVFHHPHDSIVRHNTIVLGEAAAGIYLRRVPFFGDVLPSNNRIENNAVWGRGTLDNGDARLLVKDTAEAAKANRIARNRLWAQDGAQLGVEGLHPVREPLQLPEDWAAPPSGMYVPMDSNDPPGDPRLVVLAEAFEPNRPLLLDVQAPPGFTQSVWDMGDGRRSDDGHRAIAHSYAQPGKYIISWHAFGKNGEMLRTSRDIVITRSAASDELRQATAADHVASLTRGEVLLDEDFSSPDALRQWTIEQVEGGATRVADSALVIEDARGCTVWWNEPVEAPVLIEFEAAVIDGGGPWDRVSDLNCFWMATDPAHAGDILAGSAMRTGVFGDYHKLSTYYLGMGVHWNSRTRFRRYDGSGTRPILPEHDRFGEHLLIANQPIAVTIAVLDSGRIIYLRDGVTVLDWTDPSPLQRGWFGFRTVHNHMKISRVRIQRLLPPTP